MSTFDLLGDISPSQRTLTRLLLRNSEMTEKALFEAVSALPQEKQMSKANMQEALAVLVEKGWVDEVGSGADKKFSLKQE